MSETSSLERKPIDEIDYVDRWGNPSKLRIYAQTSKYAVTNFGVWNFNVCLPCFLGKHKQCVGSCRCE